eukprot:14508456-Alexandrium_andersonii.AAC.1
MVFQSKGRMDIRPDMLVHNAVCSHMCTLATLKLSNQPRLRGPRPLRWACVELLEQLSLSVGHSRGALFRVRWCDHRRTGA